MRVTLTMASEGIVLNQRAAFFHAEATYAVPEQVLRVEGLAFLQRLQELAEAERAAQEINRAAKAAGS